MGAFDAAPKPQEAPGADAAKGIIDANLPPATELGVKAGRERSTKYPRVAEADIKDRSKGYPKVDPKPYPLPYQDCLTKLHAAFDGKFEGKWVPGIDASHVESKYNATSKKMEDRNYILVSGNNVDEYHFFRDTKITSREPNAEEKEQIAKETAKNKSEADETTRAEIDKDAEELVKARIKDPVSETTPDDKGNDAQKMAAQAAKQLKVEGDWSMQNGKGNTRVVAVWVSSGKHFYYGQRKG